MSDLAREMLHPALCPAVRWDQMPGIGFHAVFEDYAAAVEYAGDHAAVRCVRVINATAK